MVLCMLPLDITESGYSCSYRVTQLSESQDSGCWITFNSPSSSTLQWDAERGFVCLEDWNYLFEIFRFVAAWACIPASHRDSISSSYRLRSEHYSAVSYSSFRQCCKMTVLDFCVAIRPILIRPTLVTTHVMTVVIERIGLTQRLGLFPAQITNWKKCTRNKIGLHCGI